MRRSYYYQVWAGIGEGSRHCWSCRHLLSQLSLEVEEWSVSRYYTVDRYLLQVIISLQYLMIENVTNIGLKTTRCILCLHECT